MRKIFYIIMFLLINSQLFSQVVDLYEKFTIEIDINNNYSFSISEITNFNKKISWSEANKYLNTNLNENQIQGIFTKDSLNNTILIIKSGLSETIDYKLLIKIPFKRKFYLTSTSLLYKDVVSVEIWSDKIKKLKFVNFEAITENVNINDLDLFQIKDSTCIKNKSFTKENAEIIFKQQLNSVLNRFAKNPDFSVNTILAYEDSLNLENVSLNHYWSLGKGIYPNTNKYKFNNPISFRRVQCPVFDGSVNYFSTKEDSLIKVVGFEWTEYKESVFNQQSNDERLEIKKEFEDKYGFIFNEICLKLGKPYYNSDAEGRQQTKWDNNGIKAYMFNFSSINEIRLYIYVD